MTELKKFISKGSDYYYFSIEIFGPDKEGGFASAEYGIKFDTDIDGRGDVLLWAQAVDSEEWAIEGVQVLTDSNDDVGGSTPVKPDEANGDGYDQVLFSWDDPQDPDGAFQRTSAADRIDMALKIGFIDNDNFVWRAWADKGIADPAMFDYNDAFSESQAGSPDKSNEYYPVGKLNLMDSTLLDQLRLPADWKFIRRVHLYSSPNGGSASSGRTTSATV